MACSSIRSYCEPTLTGEPSFAELLDRARGVIGEALEHEAMPLEKVIEVLTLKRYPGHNAVFSVNFHLSTIVHREHRLREVQARGPALVVGRRDARPELLHGGAAGRLATVV